MRYIILAILSGCQATVGSYDINRAIHACKDKGGLHHIFIDGNYVDAARCNDGSLVDMGQVYE